MQAGELYQASDPDVVTRDVPPAVVAVGNPARAIRTP
jgi:acetyltransferase-like isoleucine patch superfamily enzyme